MEAANNAPLSSQKDVKNLLTVLKNNNLPNEQNEIQQLSDHFDSMEKQVSEMLVELRKTNEQIKKLQDIGLKSRILHSLEKAESKLQDVRKYLSDTKRNFIQSVKKIVADVKAKGNNTLKQAVKALRLKQGLLHVKSGLNGTANFMKSEAQKIGTINNDFTNIKNHIKNIGSTVTGKYTPAHLKESDHNLLTKVESFYQSSEKLLSRMGNSTDDIIKKLEHQEKVSNAAPIKKQPNAVFRAITDEQLQQLKNSDIKGIKVKESKNGQRAIIKFDSSKTAEINKVLNTQTNAIRR